MHLVSDCSRVVLESFWDRFGIGLKSFWDRFLNRVGIVLASFWHRFGILLVSLFDSFVTVLGWLWDGFFKYFPDSRSTAMAACMLWLDFCCHQVTCCFMLSRLVYFLSWGYSLKVSPLPPACVNRQATKNRSIVWWFFYSYVFVFGTFFVYFGKVLDSFCGPFWAISGCLDNWRSHPEAGSAQDGSKTIFIDFRFHFGVHVGGLEGIFPKVFDMFFWSFLESFLGRFGVDFWWFGGSLVHCFPDCFGRGRKFENMSPAQARAQFWWSGALATPAFYDHFLDIVLALIPFWILLDFWELGAFDLGTLLGTFSMWFSCWFSHRCLMNLGISPRGAGAEVIRLGGGNLVFRGG